MSLFDGDSETLRTKPIKNSRSCDLPITKIRHFCNGRNEDKKKSNQINLFKLSNVRSGSPVARAEGSRIKRASIPDRIDLFRLSILVSQNRSFDERVARVGYNHFISNKGKWNNCFSKFSNRVFPPIFISTILQSVRKEHTTSGHTSPDSRHHLIIT